MRFRSLPRTESAHGTGWREDQCGRQHTGRNAGWLRVVFVGLLAAPLLPACLMAGAQNTQNSPPVSHSAPTSGSAPVHKYVRPHKKPVAAQPVVQAAVPPAPIAPPTPDWPAKNMPVDATVIFDSHGLMVSAQNSSLAQIFKQISTDTGAKVEGLEGTGADQRVFGTYGPGPARDVINQLLDGSGYDVLMIGDRGEGTPRRIVLTARSGDTSKSMANNTPAQPNNDDTEPEPPPAPQAEPEPPLAGPNSNGPPVPMRTPQQMMQEIQERQRQMQNSREQQQNQNPQN
ncbi:MAG TPA: hypothetical protein VMT38_08385 [Terracidiphilus sp.]|nr:hypothetical protein [Terracidiphilus sp.]